MNIRIIVGKNFDGMETNQMQINGNHVLSVYPLNECPEDAYIERDLIGALEIADFMKMAWQAGKDGQEFKVDIEEEDE